MKVGFFLLKFPVASETFVLNQIVGFIEMGYEVEIVAIHKGDLQHTHAAFEQYQLAQKTTWLLDEPEGKFQKLRYRAGQTVKGLHRASVWRAMNMARYGDEARNLILSAICAGARIRRMCLSHTSAPRASRRPNCANWGCFTGKLRPCFMASISRTGRCWSITPRSTKSFSHAAT